MGNENIIAQKQELGDSQLFFTEDYAVLVEDREMIKKIAVILLVLSMACPWVTVAALSELPPVEIAPMSDEILPVEEETPSVEDASPTEETPLVEDMPSAEETPPVEEIPPVEVTPPTEEKTPEAVAEPLSESDVLPKQEEPALTWRIVGEDEAPELQLEPGLYLLWHDAPEDLDSVTVTYSIGGLDYYWKEKYWSDDDWSEQSIPELTEDGDLVLLCYSPDEMPLTSYLSGAVNSLYLKMSYTLDSWEDGELPPVRISHDFSPEIPETLPAFSAEFKWEKYASYSVVGHFQGFTPNIARIRCAYSWAGVTYQYSDPTSLSALWDLSYMGDETVREFLENQEVAERYAEPLVSFLDGDKNSFYLRLEITEEIGLVNGDVQYAEPYYSEPVFLSRNTEPESLPEHLAPRAAFGFDLSVSETDGTDYGDDWYPDDDWEELPTYTRGQYRVTVRENATAEEIIALLPDTVPVRVRLWDTQTQEKYTFGDVSCPVVWDEDKLREQLADGSLKAGEMLVLEDMAQPVVVSAGTQVETALGTYILRDPLPFKTRYDFGDITLVLHPVEEGAVPQIALREFRFEESASDNEDPLSLAFWNKPSGATSIRAYARSGETRWELGGLLDCRSVDHNQSHALYGYIELLEPNEEPYRSYLAGEIESFSIGIEIDGGVFDGQRIELPWPGDYEYPEEIFDPFDNEGQENNAGNGYEEVDGGNNGGVREWLTPVAEEQAPQGWTPPLTVPPKENQPAPPAVDDVESEADDPPQSTPPAAEGGDNDGGGTARPTQPPLSTKPSQTPPPVEVESVTSPLIPAETIPPDQEPSIPDLSVPEPPMPEAGVSAEPQITPSPAPPPSEQRSSNAQEAFGAIEPSAPSEPAEESESPTGQRESLSQEPKQDTPSETAHPEESPAQRHNGLPIPLVVGGAAVAVVGGGAAVVAGGLSSAASGGTGLLAKLGKILLRLFKAKR